jgi:hypothetical protein
LGSTEDIVHSWAVKGQGNPSLDESKRLEDLAIAVSLQQDLISRRNLVEAAHFSEEVVSEELVHKIEDLIRCCAAAPRWPGLQRALIRAQHCMQALG